MSEAEKPQSNTEIQPTLFDVPEADAPPMPYKGPVRHTGDTVDSPDTDELASLGSLNDRDLVHPPEEHREDIALARHEAQSATATELGEESLVKTPEADQPWYKKKAAKIGMAVTGLLMVVGGVIAGSKNDGESEEERLATSPTEPHAEDGEQSTVSQPADNVEVEPTPPTTDPFVVRDRDYRPESERTDEYTPVYATSNDAQEVVDTLYKNWELANEQLETSYLTAMFYDMESREAKNIESEMLKLQESNNRYPVTITASVEHEQFDGDLWHIIIEREFDAPPVYDGEPTRRKLILKQKEYFRYDKETDETTPFYAWTIIRDFDLED